MDAVTLRDDALCLPPVNAAGSGIVFYRATEVA